MPYTAGGRSHWLPSAARRKSDTPLTYGDDSSHPHPIAIYYRRVRDGFKQRPPAIRYYASVKGYNLSQG
jgi:hypothetical protein